MKKYKLRITLSVLSIILTSLFIIQPIYAACDPNIPADCPAGLDQIEQVIGSVISVVVGLGFITMLVLLVVAGIKYLTSGGEPKAIQSAHYTVTWALLGVVFMAMAWLILLLLESFTGIKVTIFDIKSLCGGKDIPFCKP